METNSLKTICFIDDDQDMINIAKLAFRALAGVQVSYFNSATTALNYIAQKQTDLVICDYLMPEMDGTAVIKQIKQFPLTPSPIIFILSGEEDPLILDSIRKAGANLVLKKSDGMRTLGKQIPELWTNSKKQANAA